MNQTTDSRRFGAADVAKLIVCIGVCLAIGIAGAAATRPALQLWYPALRKPPYTPPAWVFGPVWTVLYILMGAAAFVVWRRGWGRAGVRVALGLFIAQLIVNGLWSPVFFGLRSIEGGLGLIMLLVLLLGMTVWRFSIVSRAAGWLLAPYLIWVCFATLLNASILVRNTW